MLITVAVMVMTMTMEFGVHDWTDELELKIRGVD